MWSFALHFILCTLPTIRHSFPQWIIHPVKLKVFNLDCTKQPFVWHKKKKHKQAVGLIHDLEQIFQHFPSTFQALKKSIKKMRIKKNKNTAQERQENIPEPRGVSVSTGSHFATSSVGVTGRPHNVPVLQVRCRKNKWAVIQNVIISNTYMHLCEITALCYCALNLTTTTLENNLTWHNFLQTFEYFLFWQGSIEHISYYYEDASEQKVAHSQEKVPPDIKHKAVSGWRRKDCPLKQNTKITM